MGPTIRVYDREDVVVVLIDVCLDRGVGGVVREEIVCSVLGDLCGSVSKNLVALRRAVPKGDLPWW